MQEKEESESYSSEQVDELQEWIENLTLRQAFFLKDTYGAFLMQQALELNGSEYFH